MNQNDVDEELLKMVLFPSFQLVEGTMYYFSVHSSYALIIYKSPRPPEEVRTVPPPPISIKIIIYFLNGISK